MIVAQLLCVREREKRQLNMATEAVVSFVVRGLASLLNEEAQLLYGVHDEVESIIRELRRMQCLLKDADSKQKGDERVRNWVAEIRDVSYDAEDIIDTFIVSQTASKTARRRRGPLVGRLSDISELRTRYEVGKEIRRIKLKIEEISNSMITYGVRDVNDQGGQDATLGELRRFSAMFEEQDVVGFQEERSILKERLINGESRRCVISLVGMGGAGKTTLAKKLYREVKNNFDCHAFIYLSQKYTITDVMINIVECITSLCREEIEKRDEIEWGEKISDHLREKRYLVVIDDVWTMKAWEMLKRILPDNLNKSRVVLTTRYKKVALGADRLSPPHEMRFLDSKEGWELFMKIIFPGGNASVICPSEVEETGRQILAKCHGLPLAIEVLGGLLSTRDVTLSEWSKVLTSVRWHLSGSSNHCGEILALSYHDLPHYLKPCFLYLGLFPEGSEIHSNKLIRLWIAEGFIEQRGNAVLEDVAEDYLNELISRSMIQVASRRCNGSVRTCCIHDLLRDLSISEAIQNNFFTIDNDINTNLSSTSVRRLALYPNIEMHKVINRSAATLRSMLNFSEFGIHMQELLKIGGKSIRVLDAERVNTGRTLPKKIGEFVHLRYLNLRSTRINNFPIFMGNLSNLQTLELTCHGTLPNTIWNLERLRHLYAYRCDVDGYPDVDNVRNIQTLCLVAGSWMENGLDKMTNLRKLGITEDLMSEHNVRFDLIEKLFSLRSLKIMNLSPILFSMSFAHHLHLYKMFLAGQMRKLPDLPPYLSKLTLYFSQLEQDAIAILEKLPHLRILRLWEGSYCSTQMICSSEGFPQLEFFQLQDLELEEWIAGEGAMPSLKNVELLRCSHLKILPVSICHLLKQSKNDSRKKTSGS